MFLSDAILGHPYLVIEIIWSELVGMDSFHREDELVVTFRANATLVCTFLFVEVM